MFPCFLVALSFLIHFVNFYGRRDWPNLPSELTEQIASRLLRYDVAEYIRLRATCKAWRECICYSSDLDSRQRLRFL